MIWREIFQDNRLEEWTPVNRRSWHVQILLLKFLGVYSLRWETLGQCLYTTSFEQNAVSVSLSPISRHLVVGLTHRIITSERWVMARVFKIPKVLPGDRLPVLRELEQSRDSRINCIRWLPVSGQGLIYATNTGQLVILS